MLSIRNRKYRHEFELHLKRISPLPLLHRLFARGSRKHTLGVMIGFAIMLAACAASKVHIPYVHEVFIEAITWCLHGFGAFPIMRHLEPFWNIVLAGSD